MKSNSELLNEMVFYVMPEIFHSKFVNIMTWLLTTSVWKCSYFSYSYYKFGT